MDKGYFDINFSFEIQILNFDFFLKFASHNKNLIEPTNYDFWMLYHSLFRVKLFSVQLF